MGDRSLIEKTDIILANNLSRNDIFMPKNIAIMRTNIDFAFKKRKNSKRINSKNTLKSSINSIFTEIDILNMQNFFKKNK